MATTYLDSIVQTSRSLSFLVEGIYMIDWNNLLKCLAFGALAPIPLLCLLTWAGIHPVLMLLADVS